MIRSRRKLSVFGALPPYLGGKRRLAPLIFREIDRIIPRRRWRELTFLDAFHGGGSVSLYAKAQGFTVIATDIAERAIVIGKALVENSRVRLSREDVLRLLTPHDRPAGRVESTMTPSVFTQEQGRFIDTALSIALETGDSAKAALIRLLMLRMALLCHAYAQVRKGTIHRVTTGDWESITESAMYHYADGLRLTTPMKLWSLAQQINAGVFEGRATVIRRSVLEALPEIQADVAYFDPPYPGVMSYEREYKTIDEILEGASRPTSPFTAKTGASLLDGLFERATHIPVWVLSLGNAVVGIEELEGKMAKHGRHTKAISLRFQHLPAVATEEKKATNREFLVIGVDPKAPLLRETSVRGMRIEPHVVDLHLPDTLATVHADPNLRGSECAPAEALPHDPLEERDPTLAHEVAPGFGDEAVSVSNLGVDEPDAVLGESSFDGNGEGTRQR